MQVGTHGKQIMTHGKQIGTHGKTGWDTWKTGRDTWNQNYINFHNLLSYLKKMAIRLAHFNSKSDRSLNYRYHLSNKDRTDIFVTNGFTYVNNKKKFSIDSLCLSPSFSAEQCSFGV